MATILQLINADRSLSSFVKWLRSADLEETLNGPGPFTILAPVNLAWGGPVTAGYEGLLTSGNNVQLAEQFSYHILTEKKLVKDLYHGQKLKTFHGKELEVSIKDGEVRIDGALIMSRDRQGSNGVVHSINAAHFNSAKKPC